MTEPKHDTATTGYSYLWEFLVDAARVVEFERHYGPEGTWVALFRRARGYLGTWLLRDPADPLRFVTLDRWESADAYTAFRANYAGEYAELDQRCEQLTRRESSLGEFHEIGA